jgi:hypothetical protein
VGLDKKNGGNETVSILKSTLLLAVTAILFSGCSSAIKPRIDFSVPECDDRYGAPLENNISNFSKYGARLYKMDEFLILVRVKRTSRMWGRYTWKDFLLTGVEYAKPKQILEKADYIYSYFGKPAEENNEPLSQEEIDRLLYINIEHDDDDAWKVLKENDDYTLWKNNENFYALYDKKYHIFKVAVEDFGKKWLNLDDAMRGL